MQPVGAFEVSSISGDTSSRGRDSTRSIVTVSVSEHDICPVSRASVASPSQDFRVLHDVTLQRLVIAELHERRLGDDPLMPALRKRTTSTSRHGIAA